MDPEELKRRVAELKAQGMSVDQVIATLRAEKSRSAAPTPQPVEPTPQANPRAGFGDLLKSALQIGAGAASLDPRMVMQGFGNPNITGMTRAAASGASLGTSDELEGVLRGIFPGHTIKDETARVRQEQGQFREAHPVVNFAGEMTGGLVPITGLLGRLGLVKEAVGAAKPISTLGKFGRSVAGGAGVGGIAGFAGADPTEGDFMDRLKSRMGAGAVGAGVGAGIGGLAPVVGAFAKPIIQRVGPIVDDASDYLEKKVGEATGSVPVSRESVLKSLGDNVPQSKDELRSLAESFFGQYGKAEKRALSLAANRVEKDGLSWEDALKEVSQTTAGGRPVVVADLAGEGSRRLLGSTEAMSAEGSAEGRNFLKGRSGRNRGIRMADDVSHATETEPVNLTTRADEIAEENKPGITAAYEDAYDTAPRVKLSPESKRALATPETQKALEMARRANAEAVATRYRAPLDDVLDEQGKIKHEVGLETLDAIKKSLDARIADLSASPGTNKDLLASLTSNRAALVGDMESQHPKYRQAKGFAEEAFRLEDAVGIGADLGKMTKSADFITASLDRMSPAELTEARRAAAETQRADLLDKGVNAALNPDGSVGKDKRLIALYGPDAAKRLQETTDLERAMRDTERAGKGSQTAERLADREEIEGGLPQKVPFSLKQAAKQVVYRHALPVANRVLYGGPEVATSANRLLLGGSKGPEDLATALRLLGGQSQREKNALARALAVKQSTAKFVGQRVGRN